MELFIKKLASLNLSLALQGDRLVLKGVQGNVNEEIVLFIRQRKKELVEYLTRRSLLSRYNKLSAQQENIIGNLSNAKVFPGAGDAMNQLVFDFTGDVRPVVIEKSWGYLIAEYDILRSVFLSNGADRIVQAVHAGSWLACQVIDLGVLPDGEKSSSIKSILDQDRQDGFDGEASPLMRVTLIKTRTSSYKMAWTFPSVLLDSISLSVLATRFFKVYEILLKGETVFPQDEDRYGDYIRYMDGRDRYGSSLFWQQYLQDYQDSGLSLYAANAPYGSDKKREMSEVERTLPPLLAEEVNRYAERQGLDVRTIFQGAWAILLSRYTGHKDILFGIKASGRTADFDWAELRVGMYENRLPLRVPVDEDQHACDWLTTLGENVSQVLSFFDMRLAEVKDYAHFEPPLSYSTVNFEREILPGGSLEGGTWKVDNLVLKEHCPYSLSIHVAGGNERLIRLAYDAALLSPYYATRMIGHFEVLLSEIVRHPGALIGELGWLGAEERREVLETFNDTAAAYPKDKTLLDLFEEQVRAGRERVALVVGEEELTFGELDERAGRLGRYLRTKGVGAETLVGISVQRSPAMVVGLLGILKAGGAYVPIDPQLPAERIRYMLQDAQIGLLLGDKHSILPPGLAAGVELLRIDGAGDKREDLPLPAVREALCADRLAYVIYTSGSTGRPKGVMIGHGSLTNFLCSMVKRLGFGAGSSLLAMTTCSFDISYLELYLPLITGGKIILAGRETSSDGAALRALIAGSRPDYMQATPSGWELLLDAGWSNEEGVRLLCGGEYLKDVLKDRLVGSSGATVWNMYGPTETTIWSTMQRLRLEERVNIGRPIDNTRIYILDGQGSLLPVGVPGELYIGGDGLARGYWRRPELTAEKFVADPFSDVPGSRLYRTGDLGRWLAGGTIEYLGRIDEQVKVRGYRIEPGEIENVLQEEGTVAQSVVVARPDPSGDLRLVGYVVMGEGRLDKGRIEDWLQERLAEYMIPRVWVELDSLPLTPSGKVDRRSLPEPGAQGLATGGSYVSPRNGVEEQLASIWGRLLGIERVGVYDNFFVLGGHSLLATRVVAAIRQQMRLEINIADLFVYPTIAGFAGYLADHGFTPVLTEGNIPAIPRQDHYPLSPQQKRLWIHEQLHTGIPAYNMAAAFILKGKVDTPALETAFRNLIERHEILRTVFLTVEGEGRQQVREPEEYLFSEVFQSVWLDEEDVFSPVVRQNIDLFVNGRFDLLNGPLIKIRLLRLADDRAVLAFVIHHLISDGLSMGIILKELKHLYGTLSGGGLPSLPGPKIHYKDYVSWLGTILVQKEMEQHHAYWKAQLSDNPARLELPLDFPRPDHISYEGALYTLGLESPVYKGLRNYSRQQQTSFFITLLALVKILLYRYSSQENSTIGTPVSGRVHACLEDQVGYYLNILVLRDSFDRDQLFEDFLKKVTHTAVEAYRHQVVPYDNLVEAFAGNEPAGRNPFYDVLVVDNTIGEGHNIDSLIPGSRAQAFDLGPGITMSPYPIGHTFSKLDLTFFFTYGDDFFLHIEYSKALFKAEKIRKLADTFKRLIESVLSDPHRTLKELRNDLLEEEEIKENELFRSSFRQEIGEEF